MVFSFAKQNVGTRVYRKGLMRHSGVANALTGFAVRLRADASPRLRRRRENARLLDAPTRDSAERAGAKSAREPCTKSHGHTHFLLPSSRSSEPTLR
jgi:hypothetical protein